MTRPSNNFQYPKIKREMTGDTGFGLGVGVASGSGLAAAQQGQGVAALLVMLAVLCFIFAYCCWGAPFCRSLCRRHCCCRLEDPELDTRFGSSDQAMVATPTIILLPHGRMLVVDGNIFSQFQADTTGLDLVELGENVLRAQRNSRYVNRHHLSHNSQGSMLEMDAETPSKDSIGSVGCFPPPTYESIYGKEEGDMPPSYSDIILHRFANLPYEIDLQDYYNDKEEIEMRSLDNCSHIITNPMNTVTYHPYATITSFSSQNFSRNLTRNNSRHNQPSTTTDSFYIENEYNNIYTVNSNNNINHNHNNQQNTNVNVNVNSNNNHPTTNHRNFYVMTNGSLYRQNASRGFISNEELHRHFSDTNNISSTFDNYNFNSNSNSNGTSSSETSDPRVQSTQETVVDVNVTERRSGERDGASAVGSINIISSNSNSHASANQNPRNHIDPDGSARADQRRDRHRDIDMDEENNNFVTLADIRESRV
ncbi:GSCOCG00005668001-RA-CDS [Cotesia congregata]|nr:GSCOCG00005668001-RA-CDS [Cotesia congregata]